MSHEEVERARLDAGLKSDKQKDDTFSRLIARDGSVWPTRDTGYRHVKCAH